MNAPALPYAFARKHGVLVQAVNDGVISLVLRDDAQLSVLAELRRHFGMTTAVCGQLPSAAFAERLAQSYAQADAAAAVVQDFGQDVDLSRLMQELPPVEDLLDSQNEAPIIRLVNALFTQAVHEGVSDIHIEPFEDSSTVRFRRDGLLREVARPPRSLHGALASRIKVMASLDIAEKRLPQDGRIALRLGHKLVDVRVSSAPAAHGERLVLRLLDKDASRLQLAALGMPDDTRARFETLLHQPHGIVLVTGPTGSGKTTTLYAALHTIDRARLNIITVEDPIEYDLPGVGQIQVNPRIDLTFARALRAILRQDPDVIMIGEIRDLETAQIAVQASLTGHLVLATLHTNDAASAVTRLIDMGIEPFLLASTLRGVLAQRLVRRLCPSCRVERATTPAQRERLSRVLEAGGIVPASLWSAPGCPACNHTGSSGRGGIFELMLAHDKLAALIHNQAAEEALRTAARAHGARPLRADGLRLLAAGEASLDELLRVTED